MLPNYESGKIPRRSVLKAAAATGGLSGLGGTSTAREQAATHYKFGAKADGWQARAPPRIEGEVNPTLNLQAGKTYRVTWTNLDGLPHNFVVIDSNGDEIVRTEILEEQGATQTVDFTATGNMVEYFSELQANEMRGSIEIDRREETDGESSEERRVPQGDTVGLKKIADGFAAPLGFTHANEEADRRFIVDQTGQIYVHGPDGLRDEPFLDIEDKIVELGVERLNGYDERGLLSLAFHPDFRNNRKFYVWYSAPPQQGTPENYDHTNVLAEYEATEDLGKGDPDTERVLMELSWPQLNHNGAITFGPDGYLYMGLGDGGSSDDTGLGHVDDWYPANGGGNGQDITRNLLGSILRIDVDDRERVRGEMKNYGIPDDNPLVGKQGLDEHYAWGFRHPWSLSFNDGDLFAADAGQNLYEEVDVVEKGGNYGWNVKEGTHCFSTEAPNNPPPNCPSESVRGEPLIDPIVEYRHTKSTTAFIDGSTVIGGYVYGTMPEAKTENVAVSALEGKYVLGNWSESGVVGTDGEIFAATPPEDDRNDTTETEAKSERGQGEELWSLEELVIAGTENGKLNRYVLAFGRGQDGELYVLTSKNYKPEGDTGVVYKLVPPEEGEMTTSGEATETTTVGK